DARTAGARAGHRRQTHRLSDTLFGERNPAMRLSGEVRLFACAVALVSSFANAGTVAQIRASSQSIDLQPLVANDGMKLTVVGPDGVVYEHDCAAGAAAALR